MVKSMNNKLLQQIFGITIFNVCNMTFAQMPNDTIALRGTFTYEQCVEYALSHNNSLSKVC